MSSLTENDIQQTVKLLRESTNEDEIIAALDILGALQRVDTVPDIMPHLTDKRSDVRKATEVALLKIGQEAIPSIVEYLPKLEPEYHINLQSLVESYWKGANVDHIQRMMRHEDNRVRWAMAWTLARPLQTVPPEDIAYIFDGLSEETLTAIRWAATQSLLTLASSDNNVPMELIQVALPVMVDNFKYGDVNLSESSVQAISLLIDPPHPSITSMLTSDDTDMQVAAVKVVSAWVEEDKKLDEETLSALKVAMSSTGWRLSNEISRLRYALSISYPDLLDKIESLNDVDYLEDDTSEPKQDVRATGEIMLPPLKGINNDPSDTDRPSRPSGADSEESASDD